MLFRYYSNTISRASRGIAFGIFMFGLMLLGIGAVIAAFPQIFAYLVAAIFFVVGAGCLIGALKVYFSYRRFLRTSEHGDEGGFTEHSGRIHELDDFDDAKG